MSFQLTPSAKNSQLLGNVISHYLSNEAQLVKSLAFVLDIVINHRLFDTDNISEELAAVYRKWTVRLNALLQSKNISARWCGIKLVRLTCEHSHQLLVANAKTWTSQLLGFVGKSEPFIIHQESIETLSYIFTYTVDKPELHREIATPNMQRYNQLLFQLSVKHDLLPTVLVALTANVNGFPANARHISEQCLQLCLSCLDGSTNSRDLDEMTIKKANTLLASLYKCGSKTNMADLWKEYLSRLIGSVHECLNRLFDTVDEESLDTELPKPYPFLQVSSDYIDAFPVLLRRIQLVQDCISAFLTTSTSIVVGVPVTHLVDLICRIYSVFEGSLMRDFKDKSEFYTLMMCLPALHLSTSKMFSSLLYCSGSELIRFSKLFSRILLRLLSEHKHKRTLKISIYNLISLCLEKNRYSFAESVHKQLIAVIIQDLAIIEQKSSGVLGQQQPKSSSQHKKRKTEVTNSDSLVNGKRIAAASTEVQVASLQALATLLNVFGFAMENGQRALVDSTVLTRLIHFIPTSDMNDEQVTLVKAELYKCLMASVAHPIETQASILPHASRLFSAGFNESSHELQMLCRKGMDVVDLVMHSRLPPIHRVPPKTSPDVAITVQEEEEEEEEEEEGGEEEQVMPKAKEAEKSVPKSKQVEIPVFKAPVMISMPTKQAEPISMPITPVELSSATTITTHVEKESMITTAFDEKEVLIEDTMTETETKAMKPIENHSTSLRSTSITESTVTKVSLEEDDMDIDMDIPMIDIAGPDSDEEEE